LGGFRTPAPCLSLGLRWPASENLHQVGRHWPDYAISEADIRRNCVKLRVVRARFQLRREQFELQSPRQIHGEDVKRRYHKLSERNRKVMRPFVCTACGTQYPASASPPESCPVCTDERQFIPASGQSWTTLEGLQASHSNKFRRLAPGLMTIETTSRRAVP